MSQHHPKAVPAGNGENELNPARRRYMQYDEDGIRALPLPFYMSEDSRRQSENTTAAVKTVARVAERGACIIEALGSDGGFPWSVMAPDGFNRIPFRDGPDAPEVQYRLL